MRNPTHRATAIARLRDANPITVRTYAGVIGLFPILSMALTSVVGNALAAVLIASLGAAVALMIFLPQHDSAR